LKHKTSPDDQLQTEYNQSTSSDMPGTFDDSDLSDLESELDISQREFEPKNFIGPLDLSKKSRPSPASPTPVNESQTNRKRSKPKRFSEEHEKYYGKGRELDTFDILEFAYSIQNSLDEPTTYQQTRSRSDSDKWDAAVKEELDALYRNKTWDICPRPTHQRVVDCRWVFKIKYNADGSIQRYKARLCAKGFTQIPGQDFDDIFAPVVRYDSLRILLALSAHYKWYPQQMDVNSAFLYGTLKEEIYMELPEGFRESGKVCRLRKCIYGLKQSPREWYECLATSLSAKGFLPSTFDPCVFIHSTELQFMSTT
jgi:hypothetical protein